MKKFIVTLAFASITLAFATPSIHAKATHTIKVGKSIKKTAHVVKAAVTFPVIGPVADLEASIDAFGVSLQGFADFLDIGVAAPLEALPKPILYVGRGVHEVYRGLDFIGQKLAE